MNIQTFEIKLSLHEKLFSICTHSETVKRKTKFHMGQYWIYL